MTDAGPTRRGSGVSGVILAAGRSSRLGRPKQLLDLDGEPLLRRVVRNAAASKLDDVILVLGYEAERIAAAVGDLGQQVIVNPDFANGQSTSVVAAVNAVDPGAEAVLILLGDQPSVVPEVIDAVIERFRETRASIVMPTYEGTPANPVLFARSLFPELVLITGDEGARSVVHRHRGEVAHVAVAGLGVPRDVDTDADYAALLSEFKVGETDRPSPAARGRGRS